MFLGTLAGCPLWTGHANTPVADDSDDFRRILLRNIALPLGLGVVAAAVFIGLNMNLLRANELVEQADQVITRAYALQKLDH